MPTKNVYARHIDGECHGPSCPVCAWLDSTNMVWKQLVGKVLTQIDASFPEGSQKDAIKDILRNTIWNMHEEATKSFFTHAHSPEDKRSLHQVLRELPD
ncbi:MAG: hypothetical protein WC346_03265 [Methanogenium sp.]|jgi:hypothetical protein